MSNFIALAQQKRAADTAKLAAAATSGEPVKLAVLVLPRQGSSLLRSQEITGDAQRMLTQILGSWDNTSHRLSILVSPTWDCYATILPIKRDDNAERRSVTLGYALGAVDVESLEPGQPIAAGATASDRFLDGHLAIITGQQPGEAELWFQPA